MSAIMTQAQAPDLAKAQAFAFKIVGDTTATLMGTLSVVGDRLGLFETLAQHGPLTTDDFAARANIDPRYAREWLSAMACHGYVAYDDASEAFSLTPEQTFCLVNQESPLYLGGVFGMWPDY